MDHRTVETYELVAVEYGDRRRAYNPDRAAAFGAALPADGVRLDLGSGPGHYLPHLGGPVIAADPAVAMVAEARRRHPGTAAVACDAEALPFRRGAIAGVWASKSLQHLPGERLPGALAQIHRSLRLGGVLDLTVFDVDVDDDAQLGHHTNDDGRTDRDTSNGERSRRATVTGDDDEFPGRLFTFWSPEALTDVLVGAGFTVEEAATTGRGGGRTQRVVARARRARTLADTVGPDMRLLVCGLNPSLYAADAGVGFARPGNRFWPAALTADLVSVDRDPDHALRHHGVGMTDLVKRATVAADELEVDEYRAGLARVERLLTWLRPGAVCFVGLAGWRAAVDPRAQAGVQATKLAGAPVYVMPSTSGLNAHARLDDLTAHLRAAADLAGQRGAAAESPSTLT